MALLSRAGVAASRAAIQRWIEHGRVTVDGRTDAAYNQAPGGVCAQCSGWGHEWGLELGEWEVDDEPGSVELDTEA